MSNKIKTKKTQIVGFSTNNNNSSPIDIMTFYLNHVKNHSILKKSNHSIVFSSPYPNPKSPQIIMISAISDLSCDYTGIGDVNCYLLFLELEKEESREQFDLILDYITNNCELNKKFYVIGVIKGINEDTEINIEKDDVIKVMDDTQFNYEYKEINLEETEEVIKTIQDILIYCYKHSIYEDKEDNSREDEKGKSCNIF